MSYGPVVGCERNKRPSESESPPWAIRTWSLVSPLIFHRLPATLKQADALHSSPMGVRVSQMAQLMSVFITQSSHTQDANKGGEDWIRIISQDGYTFLVKRKVANVSGTLRNMLSVDSE